MKNLENYGVQEMNAKEESNINGGRWGGSNWNIDPLIDAGQWVLGLFAGIGDGISDGLKD